MPDKLPLKGIGLFLFIPLVLFLFLKHPFGVPYSFLTAILIMIVHRFVAQPFFMRNRHLRCFWCGRMSRQRIPLDVKCGNTLTLKVCNECNDSTKRFFDFTHRFRMILRIGIFVPLMWYIVTMMSNHYEVFRFPEEWNRFIFQFLIAVTVVTVSFAYRTGKANQQSSFPFPIHNLFLLGAKNTLLVFRYVGIWWLAASLYFLARH